MAIGYFNMHRKIKMLVDVFLVVLVVVISGKAIIGLNQTEAQHYLQRGCLSLSQEPGSTLVVHNKPHFYFPCMYYLLGKPVNQAIYIRSGFSDYSLGNLIGTLRIKNSFWFFLNLLVKSFEFIARVTSHIWE